MKKKALIVCAEAIINELIKLLLEKLSWETEIVDNPKDAVEKVERFSYDLVLIGKNKGTIVKRKLGEILYSKASLKKPFIIIYKEPGEIISDEPYLTVLPKPIFHEQLIGALKKYGFKPSLPFQSGNIDINDFIKEGLEREEDVGDFIRNLKGNVKFIITAREKKVVGFVMSGDLYILYSDFYDPYSILSAGRVRVVSEPLVLNEFLDFNLDSSVFKINIRDFVVKSVEKIDDKERLLKILPSIESVVYVKAPAYILRQIDIINDNLDVDWIVENSGSVTVKDVVGVEFDVLRLKAVCCMYLLNMVEIDAGYETRKKRYDVKIKKSFLKKIIEKIRGL